MKSKPAVEERWLSEQTFQTKIRFKPWPNNPWQNSGGWIFWSTTPGFSPTSSVEKMSEEDWDRVIGTNLIGSFLCAKAVVPKFLEQGSGRIISLTSGRAFQGAKNGAHYAASKAGIIGFSKSLALELAPHGITVNVICPGITDTAQPRGHQTEEEMYAQGQRIPLGRIGQPEDLVGPAVFLASGAAAFVTGQTILVNGGSIMW